MKMHFLWLLFLFLLQPFQAASFDFYVEGGVHIEDFSLDLAKRKGQFRESFSKAHWNNIIAPEVRLGASQHLYNCFTLEVDGGFLLNTPSANNFWGEYREDIGSRAFTCRTRNKGNISGNDFSVAAACTLSLSPQIRLTSLIGYAEQRRKFHLHPGKMKTCIDTESDPQLVDISSMQYNVRWLGPWGGIRFSYTPCDFLCFIVDAEYHYTVLKSHGRWQIKELLSDGYHFDSRIRLKQHGNAPEVKINAAIVYELCEQWKLVLHGYYAWLCKENSNDSTDHNQNVSKADQKPIYQGSFSTLSNYRIQWHAWAILGGIDYAF